MERELALIKWSILVIGLLANFISTHVLVHGENSYMGWSSNSHYKYDMRRLQAFKASLNRNDHSASLETPSISPSLETPSISPSISPSPQGQISQRVYFVTSYGADPLGKEDSTEAFQKAISDAFEGQSGGSSLIQGITNLGGAQINLEGGHYVISKPLRLPNTGVGNLMIHGGTLRASDDFPTDSYLIDLSPPTINNKNDVQNNQSTINSQLSTSSYNYEYITLKDLMLDSSYRGGGISVINSLRTSIDNCYIVHFTTNGILVQSGHETYIRNSFLGQHITAGGDKQEKEFSGIAINLQGNDNGITDVVIFSASIGILISGPANTLTGVHCYNKATGFGGTGIYLKLPGLTQTRIINCYLDYTNIVAEDPVQLHISNTFFLGDANIVLKSINGVANGINVVDNMFSGSGKGVEIVQLDQSKGVFKHIDQVIVDRNNVKGMKIKSTIARASVKGNGNSWTIDFNPILLFPNLIRHVQYSLISATNGIFPNHVLRNISQNRIFIESNTVVLASVFVTVDQGVAISS